MPTLDATPGGATSTSYVDVATATDYFDNRLHCAVFAAAVVDDQERALIMATRELGRRIIWDGCRNDEDQSLAWPRKGLKSGCFVLDNETIPVDIQNATCDLAIILLGGDITAVSDASGIRSVTVDTIAVVFDTAASLKTIPDVIFNTLRKWGQLRGHSSIIPLVRG